MDSLLHTLEKKDKSPKNRHGWFIKFNKKALKSFMANNPGIRNRRLQVYFFLLAYSQKAPLSKFHHWGKNKDRAVWHRDLKIKLGKYLGVKRKQVQRYLKDFKDKGCIIEQKNLSGEIEFLFNYPRELIAGKNDTGFLLFKLDGTGKKGYDLAGELEKAFKADSHPKENPDQLSFKINKSTRFYRKQRHKLLLNRKVQKVTPNANIIPNPLKEDLKTTEMVYKKDDKACKNPVTRYGLVQDNKLLRVPWYELKKLSEYQKVSLGFTPDKHICFYHRQLYERDRSGIYKHPMGSKGYKKKKVPPPVYEVSPAEETRRQMIRELPMDRLLQMGFQENYILRIKG